MHLCNIYRYISIYINFTNTHVYTSMPCYNVTYLHSYIGMHLYKRYEVTHNSWTPAPAARAPASTPAHARWDAFCERTHTCVHARTRTYNAIHVHCDT